MATVQIECKIIYDTHNKLHLFPSNFVKSLSLSSDTTLDAASTIGHKLNKLEDGLKMENGWNFFFPRLFKFSIERGERSFINNFIPKQHKTDPQFRKSALCFSLFSTPLMCIAYMYRIHLMAKFFFSLKL